MILWESNNASGLAPDDNPAPLAAVIGIRNALLITALVALVCIVGGVLIAWGSLVLSADWMWDGRFVR